jgi:hypothetical protein
VKKDLTTIEKLAENHQNVHARLGTTRAASERAEFAHQAAFEAVEALRQVLGAQIEEPSVEQRTQLRSLTAALTDSEIDLKVAQSRAVAATTAAKSAAQALRDEELKAKGARVSELKIALARKLIALAEDDALLVETVEDAQRHGLCRYEVIAVSPVIQWAKAVLAEEAERQAPKPVSKPDADRLIRFTRSPGGHLANYNAGDLCGFEPSVAAHYVCQGFAEYALPGGIHRDGLVGAARSALNSLARRLGYREGAESGWTTANV